MTLIYGSTFILGHSLSVSFAQYVREDYLFVLSVTLGNLPVAIGFYSDGWSNKRWQ